MPISGNASLDTAYTDTISDFDALASDLETAASEEEAVPAGGANEEYQIASQILSSREFKRLQDWVNQMRKESSATDTPQYYDT